MAENIDLHFDKLPSMPILLARGAITRKKTTDKPAFPNTQACVTGVTADAGKVQQYSQVCGFDQNSPSLPLTYPHILAFRLHMEMLLQKTFPIAPMGLIHLRNEITQHQAIPKGAKMTIQCQLNDHRMVDQGIEFDIKSDVIVEGELVWEDLSVFMARLPQKNGSRVRPKRPELIAYPHTEQWQLGDNLGRRYAAASGDYNPIHLYAPTARLLGFKRQIAHGMWSKARCIAELQKKLDSDRCRASVAFKTPIFLPATVVLHHGGINQEQGLQQDSTSNQGIKSGYEFELRNETGKRPHLSGHLITLP